MHECSYNQPAVKGRIGIVSVQHQEFGIDDDSRHSVFELDTRSLFTFSDIAERLIFTEEVLLLHAGCGIRNQFLGEDAAADVRLHLGPALVGLHLVVEVQPAVVLGQASGVWHQSEGGAHRAQSQLIVLFLDHEVGILVEPAAELARFLVVPLGARLIRFIIAARACTAGRRAAFVLSAESEGFCQARSEQAGERHRILVGQHRRLN